MPLTKSIPQTPFDVPEGTWTLAVLPDTQGYLCGFPEVFLHQTAWIAAHKETHHIRAVVHLGDIVESDVAEEWEVGLRAMETLNRHEIPYVLTLGNHDLTIPTRSTLLNRYFTQSHYSGSRGWMQKGEMENSWFAFSDSFGEWLILALEFAPRDAVLDWANTVIGEHADKQIILATHAYLYHDGRRFDWKKYGDAQEYSPTTYIDAQYGTGNDGETIWQKLVSQHANVRFVLCGHVIESGAAYLASKGQNGRVVHQILSNYQPGVEPDRGMGGGGFLRLMQFLPNGSVRVRTYSPWFDRWLDKSNQCFSLSLA